MKNQNEIASNRFLVLKTVIAIIIMLIKTIIITATTTCKIKRTIKISQTYNYTDSAFRLGYISYCIRRQQHLSSITYSLEGK